MMSNRTTRMMPIMGPILNEEPLLSLWSTGCFGISRSKRAGMGNTFFCGSGFEKTGGVCRTPLSFFSSFHVLPSFSVMSSEKVLKRGPLLGCFSWENGGGGVGTTLGGVGVVIFCNSLKISPFFASARVVLNSTAGLALLGGVGVTRDKLVIEGV